MHLTAFFHTLTVLVSILVSASSTNLDPSSSTADSPTVRGAMRFEYKRKTTSTTSSGSGTPVEAAALPIHAVRLGRALWPPHTSLRDSPLFPSQTYQFITAPVHQQTNTNRSLKRTRLTLFSTIPQLAQCHGNLPPPETLGNAQGAPFASLLDWCIRGPARCQCVYQALNQVYDIQCAMDDFLLDMVPGIVACHNHCDCGALIDRTTLERLAGAALTLARGRAGVV